MEVISSQAGRSQSSTSEENAGGVARSLDALGNVVPVMIDVASVALVVVWHRLRIYYATCRLTPLSDEFWLRSDEDLSRFYFFVRGLFLPPRALAIRFC
jgi:hypothetical protein